MPRKTVPKYSLHKGSGQAKVRLDGRDIYLGVYGTPESKRRYAEVISEWKDRVDEVPQEVTVAQLTLMYLEWAKSHYRKNGKPTSEISIIKPALKYLNRIALMLPASAIKPKLLKQVRQRMIDDGLARSTCNKYASRIKAMVKWAVAEEIVQPSVLLALQAVRELAKGRTEARETEDVKPVPQEHIQAISDEVSPVVWAMISMQLATGCRPGEVRIMRVCDIDMTGEYWFYRPESHKTEHHGQDRVIAIGPKGQAIIREWMTLESHAYLFPTKFGGPYRRDSYRNAIKRACNRAEVPEWSPNQLRHNFATEARRVGGLEGARVTLGHADAQMSLVYAERDLQVACDIVARIG